MADSLSQDWKPGEELTQGLVLILERRRRDWVWMECGGESVDVALSGSSSPAVVAQVHVKTFGTTSNNHVA